MRANKARSVGIDAPDWGAVVFTPKDVARILKCSLRTAQYLISRGKIQSFSVGRLQRVHGSALLKYIESTSRRSA
jgi:excisionase family DNA binding protein